MNYRFRHWCVLTLCFSSSAFAFEKPPILLEAGGVMTTWHNSVFSYKGFDLAGGAIVGHNIYVGMNYSRFWGSTDDLLVSAGRDAMISLAAGYEWQLPASLTLRPVVGLGRMTYSFDTTIPEDPHISNHAFLVYPELGLFYSALGPFFAGTKARLLFARDNGGDLEKRSLALSLTLGVRL